MIMTSLSLSLCSRESDHESDLIHKTCVCAVPVTVTVAARGTAAAGAATEVVLDADTIAAWVRPPPEMTLPN